MFHKNRSRSYNSAGCVSGYATKKITEKYWVSPIINKLGNLVSFKNPVNEKLFFSDRFDLIREIDYPVKIIISLIQNRPANDYPFNIFSSALVGACLSGRQVVTNK